MLVPAPAPASSSSSALSSLSSLSSTPPRTSPTTSVSSRTSSSSSSTPPSCLKGKELDPKIQIQIFRHLLRSENEEVQSKQLSLVRCLRKNPIIREQALFALMDRGEIFWNALNITEKVHHRMKILIDLINCNDTKNLTLDEKDIAMLADQCEQIEQFPLDGGSRRSVIHLIRAIAVKNPKKADELLICLVNDFITFNYDPLYLLEGREFNIIENNLEKISFEHLKVNNAQSCISTGMPISPFRASVELIRIISMQNKKKGADLLLKFVNTAPIPVVRERSPFPELDPEQRETIMNRFLELRNINPVLIDQSLCLEIFKRLHFYYPDIAEKLFVTYINNFGDFISIWEQYPELLSRKSHHLIKNLCVRHRFSLSSEDQSALVHSFPNLESLVIDLNFKSLRSSTLKKLAINMVSTHQPLHLDTPALKDLNIKGGVGSGLTQVTGNLSALQKLDITFLLRLTRLPLLPQLRTLILSVCPVLENIPEIILGTPHLHTMHVTDCNRLIAFHEIPMPHLQRARFTNCANLVSFFSPFHVPCLTNLTFICCPKLRISTEMILRTPKNWRDAINQPIRKTMEEWLKADADPDPAHRSKIAKST